MKKELYPSVALFLGSVLLVAVTLGGKTNPQGLSTLPLLTLLLMSEFGFFVTAVAAYAGARQCLQKITFRSLVSALSNLVLAVLFARLGLGLWATVI
jgi:hypothetical protein